MSRSHPTISMVAAGTVSIIAVIYTIVVTAVFVGVAVVAAVLSTSWWWACALTAALAGCIALAWTAVFATGEVVRTASGGDLGDKPAPARRVARRVFYVAMFLNYAFAGIATVVSVSVGNQLWVLVGFGWVVATVALVWRPVSGMLPGMSDA